MSDIANADFDNSQHQFFWENFHFDPDYIDITLKLSFTYQAHRATMAKRWYVNVRAYDSKTLVFSAVELGAAKIVYFNIRRIVPDSIVDLTTNQAVSQFTGNNFKEAARHSAYRPQPSQDTAIATPERHRGETENIQDTTESSVIIIKDDLEMNIAFLSGVHNRINTSMRVDSLCKEPHSGAFFLMGENLRSSQPITLRNTMVSDGIYHCGQRYDWSDFIYQLTSDRLPERKISVAVSSPPELVDPPPQPTPWVRYMNARAQQASSPYPTTNIARGIPREPRKNVTDEPQPARPCLLLRLFGFIRRSLRGG